MRTPVVVVTGVDPDAIAAVLVGLSWDLPGAVAVQHRIDPDAQVLTRVVSDATGELERVEIPLEHACVSCALREDVVPTLERLARDGRWSTVIACLPVAAAAEQLGGAVESDTSLARHLRLAGVVTALTGATVVDDLLGQELLAERGRHTGPDDRRGQAEVACAMVEYADVVALVDGARVEPRGEALDLVRALARPDALVVEGSEHLSPQALLGSRRDRRNAAAWSSTLLLPTMPDVGSARVWRVDLCSHRPFHPDRLLDDIERLGAGAHRSRGHFWLPTRPGEAQVWDGAGGQLSIGPGPAWGPREPETRLVMTGVGSLPEDLLRAFEEMLVGPGETMPPPSGWWQVEDGFEPWLGPIRHVA